MAKMKKDQRFEAKTKEKHTVVNWPEYNRALENRGNITFLINEEVIQNWYNEEPTQRGAQFRYSDTCIETMMIFKTVFRLPYQPARGLAVGILMVIGIVFTASSCSVPVNFYLRNMTASPVKVEVYLTDIDGTLKDYPVLFSKGIEPLTFSSYKKMSAVNGKIIEGANAYELLLPAQSTFFVGRGSNFHNGFLTKSSLRMRMALVSY